MQGDKGIRKPKLGEKHKGKDNQLTNAKTSVFPPPWLSGSSWRLPLVKDMNQADDDLLWLVALLESVLASSSWASLKMPTRPLQWQGRLGQDCQLEITESPLSVCRVVSSG